MTREWRVRRTTRAEDARAFGAAVGVAFGVGALTFWLVRRLLGRDPIELVPPTPPGDRASRELPRPERS